MSFSSMPTKKQQTARIADSHVLYCADWTRSIQPEPGKPSSSMAPGALAARPIWDW